ncbi:hypoxanthine phosphoribosyltransferase [bacterium]|nr:hypoxanthine phosphoribosyltransferase [bacterium]
MDRIHLKPLISENDIRDRVKSLAREIVEDFTGASLTLIGLMNGSFMFMADLVRELNQYQVSMYVDFMRITSYGPSQITSGEPELCQDITLTIQNRHVLVVDDILDTGLTLQFVLNHLKILCPESMKTCVCLDKPGRRRVDLKADYTGFEIPDAYVVGYGLDYEGRFRDMPSVSVLSFY